MYLLGRSLNSVVYDLVNFGFSLLIGIIVINYGKKVFDNLIEHTININNANIGKIDITEVQKKRECK